MGTSNFPSVFSVSAMGNRSFSLFDSSYECDVSLCLTINITLKPTGKKPVLSKSEISGESCCDKTLSFQQHLDLHT